MAMAIAGVPLLMIDSTVARCHFTTAATGFMAVDREGVLNGRTLDGCSIRATSSTSIVCVLRM